MKFNNFLELNNGRYVERRDPTNKNQCMDLISAYLYDVLGFPEGWAFGALTADKVFGLAPLNKFDKIANNPDYVPAKGDIVVWSNVYNGIGGHVGIATGHGDTHAFDCFVQNDPVGAVCQVKKYSYDHVIGGLRPKDQSSLVEETPQKGEPMSNEFLEFCGCKDENEVKAKMKEHLGYRENGSCAWGDENASAPGFLGSARKEVKALKEKLAALEASASEPSVPELETIAVSLSISGAKGEYMGKLEGTLEL